MKRISYSHNPTIYQISSLSGNLREKFNRTFNVQISCWTYCHNPIEDGGEVHYQISILPALNNTHSCTIKYFSSWKSLLSWYLKVMKEGLPNE